MIGRIAGRIEYKGEDHVPDALLHRPQQPRRRLKERNQERLGP